MQLTKHHGLGNDFLVLLDFNPEDAIRFDADLARALSDRRRGIGADGLIRVGPARGEADVTMGLRNADGSRAEMSGNGIRCLAQAVARARGHDTIDLVVGTEAGLRPLHVRPGPDPVTAAVDVDMGRARPGPELSGLTGVGEATKAATVDMGNPHLVLLVDDPTSVDLGVLGPACQDTFDQGINVELVAPVRGITDTLDLLVWERGAGITQACGTGACAAASAAHEWGVVGERVVVRMPGGAVAVTLGATVTLSGPAVFVADIEVPGCP